MSSFITSEPIWYCWLTTQMVLGRWKFPLE